MTRIHVVLCLLIPLLIAGCSPENSLFGKTKLEKALEQWSRNHGDLGEILGDLDGMSLKKKRNAKAVVKALKEISFKEEERDEQMADACHTLTAFFQNVESEDAFMVLSEHGLPELRRLLDEGLEHPKERDSELMFIMKILAMYGEEEDAEKIVTIAKSGYESEDYMWSVIFHIFSDDHDEWRIVSQGLRDPIPEKFIGVAYLDFANALVLNGTTKAHPFDNPEGVMRLTKWLTDDNPENFSYASSAATALPFLSAQNRAKLIVWGEEHPSVDVQMEVAWAQAKVGEKAGVSKLQQWALDVNYSDKACRYLEELGLKSKIPKKALNKDFKAMAEMTDWLSHPNEYGRPPDKIELYDTRTLFWPPTNDKRQVWLFKYTYNPKTLQEKVDRGLGMVGSITFALSGETTANLTPEEAYGIHCAWELEAKEDPRAPAKRSAKAGLEILKKHNKNM